MELDNQYMLLGLVSIVAANTSANNVAAFLFSLAALIMFYKGYNS